MTPPTIPARLPLPLNNSRMSSAGSSPHLSPTPGQPNQGRVLVRLVRDAAALGEGWILRLVKDGRAHHIHGYSFDLNPAATHQICCDKAATAEVLRASGVACVEHRLVLHPEMARYVPHSGTWTALLRALEEWRDVVVKDNEGTGGRGVVRCQRVIDLERAVYAGFGRTMSLAVCPFVDIRHEYRFVMLLGECMLAYEKVRAIVVGDGHSSVLELISSQHALEGRALAALLENLAEDERSSLACVPALAERRLLNWRHNLGQGASARLLDMKALRQDPAWQLAHDAANALGLVFGSVDVVIDESGSRLILEVNSGVMMEFLARTLPEGETLAKLVYGRAVEAMLRGEDSDKARSEKRE
jgi:glutathione synthase/RimK-type ligase-like ATP-grasp enzyme